MSNLAYLDEERLEEQIDGEIVMLAPALTNHTFVSGNIYRIFANYLKGKQCIPMSDGSTVFLTDRDRFVPDMMVICDPSKIKSNGVYGAPDLVVEVLSPSTARNDRKRKKEVYARCGVREYWLVSPGDRTVEVYLPDDTGFVLDEVYMLPHDWEIADMSEKERASMTTHFKCTLFDDLDISLEDIFYRVQ